MVPHALMDGDADPLTYSKIARQPRAVSKFRMHARFISEANTVRNLLAPGRYSSLVDSHADVWIDANTATFTIVKAVAE